MFKNTISPRSLTKYNLFRGVTDFGQLEQFDLFDSGHSFLKIIQLPTFLEKLTDADHVAIIENAVHVIEREFKGLDGIEDLTAETLEINDGLNTLNLINKVKEQSASTVSARYNEKSGSLLTKFHELFLKGIKDPRTGYKHYHGLIEAGLLEKGFENEIFTLLYWVTDSTGLKIERAFLLLAGQLTKAERNIYNSTKGEHDAKEVTVEWSCYPVTGDAVTALALEMNQSMAIIRNSDKMIYTAPGIK